MVVLCGSPASYPEVQESAALAMPSLAMRMWEAAVLTCSFLARGPLDTLQRYSSAQRLPLPHCHACCLQDVLRTIFDRDSEQLEFLQVPASTHSAARPWLLLPTPSAALAAAACPAAPAALALTRLAFPTASSKIMDAGCA